MGRVTWILVGVLLAACGGASAQFPFRYYTLKPASYEGKLEGATPQDDLPLSTCAPSPGKQNQCITMLKDTALKLKSDYLNQQEEIKRLNRELSSCR